jgi:signal transduction histidine kinase
MMLPRSLFARLALILCVGLALAQGLSFWFTMTERNEATANVMMGYIEREVASSIALLDRLPPAERPAWLPRLARRSYTFQLDEGVAGAAPDTLLSARVAASMLEGIGARYDVTANAVPGEPEHIQVHMKLMDGMPLTIDYWPPPRIPMSPWFPAAMLGQLAVLGACCWLAVRLVTRPLHQLAQAADALGPDLQPRRVPEDGPSEVARAARAFNAMQGRIAGYLAERIQILAAISHDLQTPITRMRLRVDLMDEEPLQDKLRQDLLAMEALVREGLAYARTLHGSWEQPRRTDPDALLDSMVCDYTDAGRQVTLRGAIGRECLLRPQALRRVLGNLTDNALKFGGAADITAALRPDGRIAITVRDHGPGIPPDALEAVFQPFHRLETSRSRDTGGTGLGLAIARQLTLAMDGELALRNAEGGGLEATLVIAPAGVTSP